MHCFTAQSFVNSFGWKVDIIVIVLYYGLDVVPLLLSSGLYQICKYFLANLQIAKLHFANLHFTHPSFYQTFFVQTYNLPNTFCQTYIF